MTLQDEQKAFYSIHNTYILILIISEHLYSISIFIIAIFQNKQHIAVIYRVL